MQKICSLDEYCDLFSQSSRRLLDRLPVQRGSKYEHTVYSTLGLSTKSIEKTSTEASRNALDLLKVLGCFHFNRVPEDIFKMAWVNLQKCDPSPWLLSNQLRIIRENCAEENWDPIPLRQAISVLSSYSLVQLGDRYVSLHPLVHSFVRESLSTEETHDWWLTSILTLYVTMDMFETISLRRMLLLTLWPV